MIVFYTDVKLQIGSSGSKVDIALKPALPDVIEPSFIGNSKYASEQYGISIHEFAIVNIIEAVGKVKVQSL